MASRLNHQDIRLLKEIASKHNPSLLSVVTLVIKASVTIEQREQLREVIAMEFVRTGLGKDDEPNERGILLERLIDRLGDI